MRETVAADGEKDGNTMVDRAMQILDYLCDRDEPAGISDIANALVLPKANVFRILNSLERWKAVERRQNDDGYRLGLQMVKLGARASLEIKMIDLCKPMMASISNMVGETANLGVLEGDHIWGLLSVTGQASVLSPRQMPFSPLYCSSIGKAYLAYFDDERLQAYFATALVARTPRSIVTYADFKQEQEMILAEGFSHDNEEYENGLYCIAVPILNHDGQVVAGLSVSGPSSRRHAKLDQLRELLRDAKVEIERFADYITV